ncbi:hypothetical protein COW36_23720 [bacterium (Candidatus Blackallbacteria) CG17_big_fil_post_rev_8_21_14_2_50_48_46]|uniref:YkgJ family cysteine cluster protein n=1 Tax=bacterium (Candidatus Blackallbacteria) CG17_big_fil_post_rev_8_21_14_2_50_48_46 TaxID=2014261 RepID=A0A2M7FY13_9BACT|nr:MAG: zinc/iron-chelating domain-containing protein [bacterium (Candidatus Blackallbacteria) CG18_big_fil_WC_8_21_14_2_50_49_26]PIW14046.1 MAG: hypothetical protein COW36_23720 [bacterium (Candidatus Blackallbacteria) CG17_big_fil_post_rev_8_21_14_2_50_48_46]PIW50734.1 MAG: hypothetical protein COW20_01505 [bacterium (Candidatus Blackallbacteria) CG13_big_fil_rev_8_21_14_2_50_49_14]
MPFFEPYHQLLNDLEGLCEALSTKHAAHLSCQAGCSGCCLPGLGVFQVEADALKTALKALAPEQQAQVLAQARQALAAPEAQTHCALLLNDLCTVYAQRPVICRTHGLPVYFQDEEAAAEGEVLLDVCPLNFTEPGALEALELPDTLALDRLNLRLAAINHVYCRDQLQDLGLAQERVGLAELALETLEN